MTVDIFIRAARNCLSAACRELFRDGLVLRLWTLLPLTLVGSTGLPGLGPAAVSTRLSYRHLGQAFRRLVTNREGR